MIVMAHGSERSACSRFGALAWLALGLGAVAGAWGLNRLRSNLSVSPALERRDRPRQVR